MSRLILNTVIYNRDFVHIGGINCAIYLSTILYQYSEWSTVDGWMNLNIERIQLITGLEPEEQFGARVVLRDLGVLRDGMNFDEPAMCIDLRKLDALLVRGR